MSSKIFILPSYKRKPANKDGYYYNRNKKLNYKKVYRYDLNGNFIGEFKFNKLLCEENNLNYNGIRLAMRPTWSDKKRILSSMNSIWILKEDFSEDELKRKVEDKRLDSNLNPEANKRSKRIVQRDANTKEVIQVWSSLNQAGKEGVTNYSLSCICRVLNGTRKTYAGCTWEYEKALQK